MPWSGHHNGEAYKYFALRYINNTKIFLCPSDFENKIHQIDTWTVNKDNSVFASYLGANYLSQEEQAINENYNLETFTFWDFYKDDETENFNHKNGQNVLHLGGHVRFHRKR